MYLQNCIVTYKRNFDTDLEPAEQDDISHP